MAHLILDRVLETTTTTGTGIITLNGNVAGFRAFSLLGNGNTTDYLIIDEDRNQWEIGIGTYGSSGNTLSRTTVVLSTNSNNAVNFQTGTKYVKITNAASKTITTDNISTYAQPLDADLTAIAALTGTTGLLKKTASNTWALDTTSYYSSGSNASFGTLSASSTVTLSGGTANGVAYLNGSKVLTTGSALTFDGTNLTVPAEVYRSSDTSYLRIAGGNPAATGAYVLMFGGTHATNPGRLTLGTSGTSATSYIDFTAGGSEQMRLTSTGLGIGTSSPQAKLQVLNTLKVSSADQSSGNVILGDGSSTSFNVGIGRWNGATNAAGAGGLGYFAQGSANSGGHYWYTGDAQAGSTTLRATLDTSGNLGLGVVPSAWSGFNAFQVGAGGSISGTTGSQYGTYVAANIYNNGSWRYLSNNYAVLYQQYANSGFHAWYTAPSGTAGNAISFTQAMTLDASSNLSVLNDIYTGSASNSRGLYSGSGSANLLFGINGTEKMRLDASGILLVGTTSALISNTQMSVQGSGRASAMALKGDNITTPAGAYVWNSTTTGNGVFFEFGTEATFSLRGSISYNRAGGLTAYNTTSDYRAKDIISSVLNSGEVIDSVPVYMGKMKGATQERPMFIAHETPDYAHTGEKDAVDEDGNPVYQQMDASALIPVMWAEIQSLRKRITTLEAK